MPLINDTASRERKQKKDRDRACDACRRRKTKCDGTSMLNHVCSNCIQSGKPCTYVEASTPRGPPKAYITTLEDRVEALEALLQQIRPDQNFSEELGPPVIRGSWKTQDGFLDAPSTSFRRKSPIANNILPPLLIPYQLTSKHPGPNQNDVSSDSQSPRSTHLIFRSKLPSKRTRTGLDFDGRFSSSSEESSDEASSSSEQVEETVVTSLDGREKITLVASENDDAAEEANIRFHGRSSTAGLIETTRQFKHMHIRDTVSLPEGAAPIHNPTPVFPDNLTVAQWRRPLFWKRPVWENSHEAQRVESLDRLRSFLEYFPSPDLAQTLINLYFQNSNLVFPLLHRPTFIRQWKEQLHHRNIWFAGVCLLVFAIGSRWCNDERVLPELTSEGDSKQIKWGRAGRQYFDIAVEIHLLRQTFFHPTSLFEVQTYVLMGLYLRSTAVYPTAWIIVSVGLRKVQDIGAHRKKVYRAEPNIDDELWKRAFWLLVVLDRIGGSALGRACGISEEDFDLDLPLQVDDEYWTTDRQKFKQPPKIPSKLTAFIQLIKLTQIMAFTMKTLYVISKSKNFNSAIPLDRNSITKQVSLAMAEWLERLPEHLQWHGTIKNPAFLMQSAALITLYHLTQILIWRSLISLPHPHSPQKNSLKIPVGSSPVSLVTDPAINRCIEAALACARIVEVQLQLGVNSFYIPGIINVSYICVGILSISAWNLKMQEKEFDNASITDLKPPLASRIEECAANAKTFLRVLEVVKDHWEIAEVLLEELTQSLIGLEIRPSNHDVNETYDLKKSRSRSFVRGPQISAHAQYSMDVNEMSSNRQRSPREYAHHAVLHRHDSHRHDSHAAALPSFSDSEPGSHIPVPNPPLALDTRRRSEMKLRRSSINTTSPVDERSPISSPILANPASWHERGIPYISSMRRASSSSNLRSQYDRHSARDRDMSSTRPSLRPPESAVRYDDANRYNDRGMHLDERMYLSAPRYATQGHQQHGPHKPLQGSLERGQHREDSLGDHPVRDVQFRGRQALPIDPRYSREASNVPRHRVGQNFYGEETYDASESR